MNSSRHPTLSRDILLLAAVLVTFAAMAYVFNLSYVKEELIDVIKWRARIQRYDQAGILLFIGVFALANGAGFPRILTSGIAGALYGAHQGILISQTAVILGATLAFFSGRWIIRGSIERRLPDRLQAWHAWFNRNGFQKLLYIRLFPVGNAFVTSLLSGASRIRFMDFLLATFLGYLPLTISFALFGSSTAKSKPFQLGLGFLVFLGIVFGRRIFMRSNVRNECSVMKDTRKERNSIGD